VPVLDARGELIHDRGAVAAPGLHVLGLRFQRRRVSHFIGGVDHDAGLLAERLIQDTRTGARPALAA
jgi:putative flavoprotein involved in K+ transport